MSRGVKIKLLRFLIKRFTKDKAKYIVDFISFGIGFFFSTGIALLISILVNKNLPKEDLAIFNYNKSFLEFFSYVFTIVLYRSYLRFNVSGNNISLFKKVKIVNLAAFIILEFIAFRLTDSYWTLLFPFFIFYEERLYFFRSLMKVAQINYLKILVSLTTLGIVLYLYSVENMEPNKLLFGFGVGFTIAFLFQGKLKGVKTDHNEISWKTILLYSLPAVGSIIVRLSLDISSQYLIKSNYGFNELSKYSIATRVLLGVKLFSSLLMMFFPVVYFRELKNKNKKFILRMKGIVIFCMFVVASLGILFNEQLYFLMGASKYVHAKNFFNLLVISEFVFILGSMWGIYLNYALKTHILLLIYFLGACVNLCILIVFLPTQGMETAPISILASNIFMAILMIFLSHCKERKYLNSPT